MEKFKLGERAHDYLHRYVSEYSKQWADAYKDVPNEQTFTDAVFAGANNGYIQASYDIKSFLSMVVKGKPDIRLSDAIKLLEV